MANQIHLVNSKKHKQPPSPLMKICIPLFPGMNISSMSDLYPGFSSRLEKVQGSMLYLDLIPKHITPIPTNDNSMEISEDDTNQMGFSLSNKKRSHPQEDTEQINHKSKKQKTDKNSVSKSKLNNRENTGKKEPKPIDNDDADDDENDHNMNDDSIQPSPKKKNIAETNSNEKKPKNVSSQKTRESTGSIKTTNNQNTKLSSNITTPSVKDNPKKKIHSNEEVKPNSAFAVNEVVSDSHQNINTKESDQLGVPLVNKVNICFCGHWSRDSRAETSHKKSCPIHQVFINLPYCTVECPTIQNDEGGYSINGFTAAQKKQLAETLSKYGKEEYQKLTRTFHRRTCNAYKTWESFFWILATNVANMKQSTILQYLVDAGKKFGNEVKIKEKTIDSKENHICNGCNDTFDTQMLCHEHIMKCSEWRKEFHSYAKYLYTIIFGEIASTKLEAALKELKIHHEARIATDSKTPKKRQETNDKPNTNTNSIVSDKVQKKHPHYSKNESTRNIDTLVPPTSKTQGGTTSQNTKRDGLKDKTNNTTKIIPITEPATTIQEPTKPQDQYDKKSHDIGDNINEKNKEDIPKSNNNNNNNKNNSGNNNNTSSGSDNNGNNTSIANANDTQNNDEIKDNDGEASDPPSEEEEIEKTLHQPEEWIVPTKRSKELAKTNDRIKTTAPSEITRPASDIDSGQTKHNHDGSKIKALVHIHIYIYIYLFYK